MAGEETPSWSTLCLVGGGLDGRLALALAERAGARVHAVHFRTGFAHESRRRGVDDLARRDASLEIVDVEDDYLREVVLRPKHGYGSAMNPCIDCRAFMLRRADALARSRGVALLCTGEVLGQRAMDQSRRGLALAERDAGVEGRVLRPLSAGLLARPPAAPAHGRGGEPWPSLHGRGREGQRALARRIGIATGPTPSGRCCKLADPRFAARLRDLIEHHDGGGITAKLRERLDRGRHFRLGWDAKVVVARDEEEARWLEATAGEEEWRCRVADGKGALCVIEGRAGPDRRAAVAALAARYGSALEAGETAVALWRGTERLVLRAAPAAEEDLARWRV